MRLVAELVDAQLPRQVEAKRAERQASPDCDSRIGLYQRLRDESATHKQDLSNSQFGSQVLTTGREISERMLDFRRE